MKKIFITAATIFAFSITTHAATVDRSYINSAVLGTRLPYLVIRPAAYQTEMPAKRFGVLYLLHCLGATHENWLDTNYCQGLLSLADSVHLLIVAPYDGTSKNWWLSSPLNNGPQMSTYLVTELKPHIDSSYRTLPGRATTAIAGHSMGGYGALHNAMIHPDIFGSAVAIKAAVDLLNPQWPSHLFSLPDVLGDRTANAHYWLTATVLANAIQFKNSAVALRIYSGLSDSWFAQENHALHVRLDSLGIVHDYIELYQNHYSVTRDVVKGMLAFCDSTFAGATNSRARHGSLSVPPLSTPLPLRLVFYDHPVRQRGSVYFDIRGRSIDPVLIDKINGAILLTQR